MVSTSSTMNSGGQVRLVIDVILIITNNVNRYEKYSVPNITLVSFIDIINDVYSRKTKLGQNY